MIKILAADGVFKPSLLPLIIKQKQNTTEIETNAEICYGFLCVPMLLVKSHYGVSITLASLSRPQSNDWDKKEWPIVKQDGMRYLSLGLSAPNLWRE